MLLGWYTGTMKRAGVVSAPSLENEKQMKRHGKEIKKAPAYLV